jgi:hypothetical protein
VGRLVARRSIFGFSRDLASLREVDVSVSPLSKFPVRDAAQKECFGTAAP